MVRKNTRTSLTFPKKLIIPGVLIVVFLAIIIPKFITLTTNAQAASTTAIAGALSAANATNFATRTINATSGNAVFNCTDVGSLYQGSLPIGYAITAAAVTAGNTIVCNLSGPGASMATFSATGIG